MSIIEIIFIGYLFNVSVYLFYMVYIMIIMITMSIYNKVEFTKLVVIIEQLKSRTEYLKNNIKSYKKYDYGILFPFMKIILLSKILYFSLKYGTYNSIIFIEEYELDKLEQLYDTESNHNV